MLPKVQRMDRAVFHETFSRGRRSHTPGLLLVSVPAKAWRAAVVVSKKVSKSAVVRNRLRRQIYAALSRVVSAQAAPRHAIIIVKPAARGYDATSLSAEVNQGLSVGFTPRSR